MSAAPAPNAAGTGEGSGTCCVGVVVASGDRTFRWNHDGGSRVPVPAGWWSSLRPEPRRRPASGGGARSKRPMAANRGRRGGSQVSAPAGWWSSVRPEPGRSATTDGGKSRQAQGNHDSAMTGKRDSRLDEVILGVSARFTGAPRARSGWACACDSQERSFERKEDERTGANETTDRIPNQRR